VGIGGNIGPISISAGPSITFSICPPKCVKISSGGRPYGSYNCPPDSASPGRCPARGSPCKDTCRDVIAAAAAGHKP
jgi:hypothetical protein